MLIELLFEFFEFLTIVLTDEAIMFVDVCDDCVVDTVVSSAVLFVNEVNAVNELLNETGRVLDIKDFVVLTMAIKEESKQFAFWCIVFGFKHKHD